MRGNYEGQATMLCIVSPDQRVPKEHPFRRIKIMADKEATRQKRKGIKPKTLGGDKGYDTRGFVSMLKKREITPHVS